MIKVFLILKPKKRKHIMRFIERDLDPFLARHGYLIMSYEVVGDGASSN